jgi:hypothetical protein
MLEYVNAGEPVEIWSAEGIRQDSPEDAHRITDAELGVLLHSGGGDGALVIGTKDALIARFEKIIAHLRDQDGDNPPCTTGTTGPPE